MVRELSSTRTLELVFEYVEALRSGKVDLSADDMRRAAAITATEVVRESLAPREVEQAYLRGVLVKEGDGIAFMNANNDKTTDPAMAIDMLIGCGLLNRNKSNQRLQFAYDPVAEQLAAWWIAQGPGRLHLAPLREAILASSDSPLARAMAEIERGALWRLI
jgi:hypothetical protein